MKTNPVNRWYIAGCVLIFPVIILGELLWVLDPIRLPGDWYLLDYIHILISLTAVIPLMWAISAALLWIRSKGSPLSLTCLRIVIILSSLTASVVIILNPKQLLALGISIGIAFVAVLTELAAGEYRKRRRWPARTVTGIMGMIVSLLILLYPTGYLVTYPGLTMNMNRYIQIEEGESQGQGSVSGVLVFERPAFPIDWLYAALFPHYTFEKQEKLGMSLGEYQQVVRRMKHDTNAIAAAVALGKLGIGEGVVYEGVSVTYVLPDSPAHGILQAGDVIIGMNGRKISRTDQLLDMMVGNKPGEMMELTVQREGEPLKLAVSTMSSPEDPERAVMGIQIMDQIRLDVPVELDFTPYLLHEGGPSHGAMLALAIIDQLTPGGVIKDHKVAGTGTIRVDGSIGPVGGVRQKAFTVERSGADVFFVPEGQEGEARLGSRKLDIVPVRTLDDILHWLQNKTDTIAR